MSTTQTIDQTIYQVKDATLKCSHNAQTLKDQHTKIQCKKLPSKRCIIIPVQNRIIIRAGKSKLSSSSTCVTSVSKPKNDYCSSLKSKRKKQKKLDQQEKSFRLIFPEMRGSVLYSKCYCVHRNGLQDDCPLTQCQGQPECLTKPWATCPPGKYIRKRYPELF